MPSYVTPAKPSTSYSEISDALDSIEFLFQDGVNYFFQDGIQKLFAASDDYKYTTPAKPSTVYTTLSKPI
jgi:hypothetical protein